jgi:hypothetical protein
MALDAYSASVFLRTGTGRDVLLCPWNKVARSPFHIGVIARCRDVGLRPTVDEQAIARQVLHVKLEGRERIQVENFSKHRAIIYGEQRAVLDLKRIRAEYPVICGAGWYATGGYTEAISSQDIRVVIQGIDLETLNKVEISGNLGGIISPEQAHTVEHAIIRSLHRFALCSPKSLLQSTQDEANELKQSVEWGLRYNRPEFFGLTESGACGNPFSNNAQIYMAEEFMAAIKEGHSMLASAERARHKTMSRLTFDMGITTREGISILQGLKKGMFHDDTPLTLTIAKKILARFPINPW